LETYSSIVLSIAWQHFDCEAGPWPSPGYALVPVPSKIEEKIAIAILVI